MIFSHQIHPHPRPAPSGGGEYLSHNQMECANEICQCGAIDSVRDVVEKRVVYKHIARMMRTMSVVAQ